MEVKESALIFRRDKMLTYRGRVQRVVVSKGKRPEVSVSIMEGSRVRDTVNSEWFSKALWQEAVSA